MTLKKAAAKVRKAGYKNSGQDSILAHTTPNQETSYLYCRWEATSNKVYFNGTPAAASMEGHIIAGGYCPSGITTTIAGTVLDVLIDVGRKTGETFLDQGKQWASSNGDTSPIVTIFPSTVTEPWEKTSASPDWLWQHTGRQLVGKRTGDATASFRVGMNADLGQVFVNSGVFWSSGSNTPEGAITAPVGSIYSRTNGGAGTSFYVKESGTGNTGWVAK